MRKYLYLLLLFIFPLCTKAQKLKANPYGLQVVNSYEDYHSSYAKDPKNKLIEIQKAIPNIKLDIRYATKNNFMNQVMYKEARAFARKPVVEQLKKIQFALNKKGYGLKIFDAYRPYTITLAFYQKAKDKNFVANPKKGSKHNRGCAIDLTLIDLKTGKELQMPTPYDSFAAQASPSYSNLPAPVIKNRTLLITTMQAYGFRVITNEWWHFDFVGWKKYPLMDIPFEKL
ncbi:M15 family metallopeptidase [Pedobacter panaciterrae]|jgi:D-alanyl-D-alanine dipeptidase|uniref:D-alanyl-D-alanine dipeptidase n=1 Tax=Pedobacter panaciterrae TaxID=363849 RepID=A0ABU8NP29_9SPHI|nr:M15 family metallopeptidase [Pedobacter panaciterrae]NQX55574.1 M15 family metallopeptidase [Pedobacter panaciterrae]